MLDITRIMYGAMKHKGVIYSEYGVIQTNYISKFYTP